MTSLQSSAVREDLRRTADVVRAVAGTTPRLVRPPFGSVDREVARAIDAPIILWSVDPRDWRVRDSGVVHDRVIAEVRPGSIVVLHDVYRATVDAVPGIIDTLKRQGYTFVTVSELLGSQLKSGTTYSERHAPTPSKSPK